MKIIKKYFYLIILFIFIAITTLSTEIYLNYVGLGDPVRYDSNYMYGYAPKINQIKKRFKDSRVTINEVGLRSLEKWNQNKQKILFIGDSITYGGSYIDDKKLFTYLVCEELSVFVCGNAGVNAYSIVNMVHRSKYDLRIKNSDIVIFLVSPGDFYREYKDKNTAHFYLNNKEFFLPAIQEAVSFFATKYDLNRYISKSDDSEAKNLYDLINFSIKILDNEIERLKKNKKVLVFYTIEKNDPYSNNVLNKYIYQSIKNKFKNKIINLSSTLNNSKYFHDSVHYTEDGHHAVSKKIISSLRLAIN